MELFIGIILLVAAVFLIISVLLQSSKSHKLSGTIAGGAETFFGKTKGKTIDRVLSKVTAIVAIVFCVLVVALYVMQDQANLTGGTGAPTESTQDISNVQANPDDTTDAADTTDATDTIDDASASEDTDEVTEDPAATTDAPAEGDETAGTSDAGTTDAE